MLVSKQGLRRTQKLQQCTNSERKIFEYANLARLQINRTGPSSSSVQLVCPASPSNCFIQLVHPAGLYSWSVQLVYPSGLSSWYSKLV